MKQFEEASTTTTKKKQIKKIFEKIVFQTIERLSSDI
jgi:hypothetical protein